MTELFWAVGMLVYVVLAAIALWGAFCAIMVWRRVAHTRFSNEEEQEEFLGELEQADVVGAHLLCVLMVPQSCGRVGELQHTLPFIL